MGQPKNKTIIFVETKKKVDEITRKLRYAGLGLEDLVVLCRPYMY